jgi:hypothetical protein
VEEYYIVDVNSYAENVSLSHFSRRELERAFPVTIPISGMNWVDYSRTVKYFDVAQHKLSKKYMDEVLNILEDECIRCESVFDLYNKIGYDYKKKKYL